MNRTFTLALALVLSVFFSAATAQPAWEYALLISPEGYSFEAPDAAADGVDADDFYLNLTGEALPGSGAPAVSILSALGGSGWELVTVDTSAGQTATYYFKRSY